MSIIESLKEGGFTRLVSLGSVVFEGTITYKNGDKGLVLSREKNRETVILKIPDGINPKSKQKFELIARRQNPFFEALSFWQLGFTSRDFSSVGLLSFSNGYPIRECQLALRSLEEESDKIPIEQTKWMFEHNNITDIYL